MNHHKESGQSSKMMWLMMAFCLLPLLVTIFWGSGGVRTGSSGWITIAVIIIFGALHFFVMKKMHMHSGDNVVNKDSKENKNSHHSGHGCH